MKLVYITLKQKVPFQTLILNCGRLTFAENNQKHDEAFSTFSPIAAALIFHHMLHT